MFTRLMLLLLVIAGIIFVVFKQPPKEPRVVPRNTKMQIKGSIPYWDQEKAFASFKKNIDVFTDVNIFWYFLSDSGKVTKYKDADEDKSIIDFAHEHNVKAFAVITNLPEAKGTTWDSKRVERVIKNDEFRKKHSEDIGEKLHKMNFDGVLIDYESVDASQKDNFTQFIKELSLVLHKERKLVAVALHPKRINSNGLGEFQEWGDLGKYADHLHIMAYEEHWDESTAGPIASIGWLKEIIFFAQSLNVPTKKFFLGVPLYGYDWDKDDNKKAKGVTFKEVKELLKNNAEEKWDEASASPYFFYRKDGDTHEVWYENARSVKEKVTLVEKVGFGGVSFWRLGEEDSKIFQSLR